MTSIERRLATRCRWLSVVTAVSWACIQPFLVQPFLVQSFDTVYLPRTRSFARAPIANLSTEPQGVKAGVAIQNQPNDSARIARYLSTKGWTIDKLVARHPFEAVIVRHDSSA